MDYEVLCEARVYDSAGLEMSLRLVQMVDSLDTPLFRVVAPNGDYIWSSSIEPDILDDEAIESIFTQAIEKEGGTFKELY